MADTITEFAGFSAGSVAGQARSADQNAVSARDELMIIKREGKTLTGIRTDEIARRMNDGHIPPGAIARRLGITEGEARLLITGRCVPSWEHLCMIAALLGCSTRDLIGEVIVHDN